MVNLPVLVQLGQSRVLLMLFRNVERLATHHSTHTLPLQVHKRYPSCKTKSFIIPNIMPSKKRAAPTATASSSQHVTPKKSASFDSTCQVQDGLDDGASLSSLSSSSSEEEPTMHSSCRRRLGSGKYSSQERVLRDKQNIDPKHIPIDALVDHMICFREDNERAETRELCSKLSAIIQEMQGDNDGDVPRIINKDEVGLVTP